MSGRRAGAIAAGVAVVVGLAAFAYGFGPASDPLATRRVAAWAGPAPSDGSVPRSQPAAARLEIGDPLTDAGPVALPAAGRFVAAAAGSGCARGARQRDVEASLAAIGGFGPVSVDGAQSPADCAAIRNFQRRFGINPANGQATALTADVARRIAGSMSPQRRALCGVGAGVTACVDLTLQTVWVVRDGVVVFGPTVVRTGLRRYATPSGTFAVNKRARREWSNPYRVWLPYWQRFHGGMGFHETTTYIHNGSLGSHGCVNLLRADAARMWDLVGYGTTVRIFGRRPGT